MEEWWEKEWFDCFQILGITENATDEEIKHAYRLLAHKYHPDNENSDSEMFRKITLAHDTLLDKVARDKYINYKKVREEKNSNANQSQDEVKREMTFEEIVGEYRSYEKKIKLSVRDMLKKAEEKERQFTILYDKLCACLKDKKISEDDYKLRSQKIRSIELANVLAIDELIDMINEELYHMCFEDELKTLTSIKERYSKCDEILSSSYKKAILLLTQSECAKKSKKIGKYILGTAASIAGIIIPYFIISFLLTEPEYNDDLLADNKGFEDEYDFDAYALDEAILKEETTTQNMECHTLDPLISDCILFKPVPENMEYDEISNEYKMGPFTVVSARKDGIGYIINKDNNEVIISNYISHGAGVDGKYVFLSADGYDYTLDASNLRNILEVESAYSEESEPFYLDGYGEVIKAKCCGENYLIDAKTRYSLISWYDDYSSMYYDEEFACNAYCFNYGSVKRYVDASNPKKVLRIEEN